MKDEEYVKQVIREELEEVLILECRRVACELQLKGELTEEQVQRVYDETRKYLD